MKYTTEMGSGAMLYTLDLIRTDSGIRKPLEGYKANREHADHIPLLSFFHNKESRLKTLYRVSYSP
jgi:hypothetical protein